MFLCYSLSPCCATPSPLLHDFLLSQLYPPIPYMQFSSTSMLFHISLYAALHILCYSLPSVPLLLSLPSLPTLHAVLSFMWCSLSLLPIHAAPHLLVYTIPYMLILLSHVSASLPCSSPSLPLPCCCLPLFYICISTMCIDNFSSV